jgi:high-affinity iron transporter
MLGTAIIIFREVLEAALIVGLVLAATRGVGNRIRWISAGIGGGILGAVLLALVADQIGSMAHGMGQEVLNASILFAAVLMLSWHLLWMKSHSIEIANKLRQVGSAVVTGDKEPVVLAVIIGLAILREGSESVLFLYGLAAAGTNITQMFSGTVLGLLAGIAAGAVLYLGIARIPTGRLFQVSGWLILLLTAGLASQAVSYLVQADMLPAMGYAIWDSSSLLSQSSAVGNVLHILVGYVDKPMGIQILTYLLTVGILVSAMSYMNRQDQRARELRDEGRATL